MGNITIAKRLILLIVVSLIALIAVGAIGLTTALTAQKGVEEIRDDSLISIKTLGSARNYFMRIRVNAYGHVLEDHAEEKAKYEATINELATKMKALFALAVGLLS